MGYTYKDLKSKTAAQLKEIASGIDHEAVKGYTQLNKEHLLTAICEALGIDTFEHHRAIGIDKTSIKAKIRELKLERDKAIQAKKYNQVHEVRKEIKKLKNKLRKAVV